MAATPPPPPEQQQTKKRSRSDRAKKLRERGETRETVVKCSLRSLLLGSEGQKNRVAAAIDRRVVAYSKRVVLASRGLNLLARERCETAPSHAALAALEVDLDVVDVNTVRQLMLGTTGCAKAVPRVQQLHQQRPFLLHDIRDRCVYDGNIYTDGAVGFAANVHTHLKENLLRVIKKVVYECTVGSRDEQVLALFRICGWPPPVPRKARGAAKKKPAAPPVVTLTEDQAARVSLCRGTLGLQGDAKLTRQWLKAKSNVAGMLKFFVLASRLLDEHAAPKRISLLPICTRKRHFITIDTNSLFGVARDARLVDGSCQLKSFRSLADAHWGSVLDFARVAPHGGRFTGTIDTDGVSVCVHFARPKRAEPRPAPCTDPGPGPADAVTRGARADSRPCQEKLLASRVVAFDPGRSNILFGVEVLADGAVRRYRLTRRQYYQEAGINAAAARTEAWHRGIRAQLQALSEVSSKGYRVADFEAYLHVDMAVAPALWKEYLRRRWAQQRLRLHGGKKRVLARFFNSIERAGGDARPVLVAYGSAKLAPGGRGEVSVPVQEVFQECRRRFETHVVDEFRSTRVHHEDDALLLSVGIKGRRRKGGGRAPLTVRGLLWCGSTKDARFAGSGKFVNRDENGALNILRCFLLPQRPAMLDRAACRGQRLPAARVGAWLPR